MFKSFISKYGLVKPPSERKSSIRIDIKSRDRRNPDCKSKPVLLSFISNYGSVRPPSECHSSMKINVESKHCGNTDHKLKTALMKSNPLSATSCTICPRIKKYKTCPGISEQFRKTENGASLIGEETVFIFELSCKFIKDKLPQN